MTPETISEAQSPAASTKSNFNDIARLLAISWLVTNIALSIADLPLRFLLKDTLHLSPEKLALFFAAGNMSNYVKPLAGVFTDTVPFRGTRRRHYTLLGVGAGGIFWLLLGAVPRTYSILLLTYTVFYCTVVLTSTSLGGRMVEVGREHLAAGRLTAQRIGTFRLATVTGGAVGGWLASRPFGLTVAIASTLHFLLFGLIWLKMGESPTARRNSRGAKEAKDALKKLLGSKVLLAAAGMVVLIAISPGFGTPLLFVQRDVLHFTKEYIGFLSSVGAATGLLGAWFYYAFCRRLSVKSLLISSVVVHAAGTMLYLNYHGHISAALITAVGGISGTLAILPVYDLAARATPRGTEAIGYAVMMSVWNATNAVSDVTGSKLFQMWNHAFEKLVWLNASTTAITLLVIPFLPAVLMRARDGDREGTVE